MAAFAYLAHALTPGQYGVVEQALSITIFFVLGVESGMGLYGARIVASAPERIPQLVPQIMLLRAGLALPAFVLIQVVAFRYRHLGLSILAINGLAILLTPFLTQWVFQGLRQMQWVAAGSALRNFVFVALVLAIVRPGSDIRWVAAAEVGGIAALGALNAWYLSRLGVTLDWRGSIQGARRLFGDVWYLGVSDFTWACLWYSPALIVGWTLGIGNPEVAWIAAAVRVVMSVHTFVWLYFFNLLPNLARDLAASVDDWSISIRKSLSTSMWPAGLIAVGGTFIAPLLIPSVFGPQYVSAVLPFQIVIWMIPVAWFSGHFRFSLIAAGKQRWELQASAGGACVTVVAAVLLGRAYGASGAAAALVLGTLVNTALAMGFCASQIASVRFSAPLTPPILASVMSIAVGLILRATAGALVQAIAACLVYLLIAASRRDVRQLVATRLQR